MIQTLADALEAKGYTELTPVQTAVTDEALGDADLLVSAQTGSGKTVGFGLAIAPTLLGDAERFGAASTPLALVIAPTRELALQVKRELAWLYANAGAVVTSCVGGMDMRDERRALDRGAHIVVATPGRLVDHIKRGSLDMSGLRAVVLDEADEMLDLGFREDLEFILSEAPEERRTLLFSATVPNSIASLARSYQKDAKRISTTAEKSQHADIEYRAFNVSDRDSENAIINVLRYYESPNAIVFCNTRAMVNRLTTRFSNRGFSVVALSGELSQNERTHALQAMRDGRARVCVATDVAARGIDLPNLELVIHAELPSNHETLLHRSGRTGRAGRKGVSAMIVPGKSYKKAQRLLKSARLEAEWVAPPSASDVMARDEERLLGDPVWEEEITAKEQGFVDKLVALHAPEKIAAAYMRLYHARQSAPEELSAAGAKPEPRAPFGPSVWFSVGVGRSQNAEPRWLLPMLCRSGDLTKEDIGAIRIQGEESFVELRESAVNGFLSAVGPDMKLEEGAPLRKLDKAPEFSARAPRPSGPRPDRGARKDFGDRPDRGPRKDFGARDGDAPRKPRSKPRADRDGDAPKRGWQPDQGPHEGVTALKPKSKPRDDAPAKGGKPTGRFGDKPAGKRFDADKPHSKPKGKSEGRFGGKPERRDSDKPGGKPAGKPKARFGEKPAGKRFDSDKPRADGPAKRPAPSASDTSKRFVPPGGKSGGKPSGKPGSKPGGKGKTGGKPGFKKPFAKGGNATPKRSKPKS
ncbi:MAG: DEAD/DEAH box helicase [Paracoccaceae bacterium]